MGVEGDVRGLPQALIDYLSHYKPGELGLNGITNCVVNFPIEEWAWYSWYEDPVSPSIDAGQSIVTTMFTVPADERAILQSFSILRTTGDNNVSNLALGVPEDYGNPTADPFLIRLSVSGGRLWWPDTGGLQANILSIHNVAPLLMEPGTTVRFAADGTGAAASTFTANLFLKRTKMVRALAPY